MDFNITEAGFKPIKQALIADNPCLGTRKKKKLSRAATARLLGVSVNTVYMWEVGLRNPNRAHRMLIALLAEDKVIPDHVRNKVMHRRVNPGVRRWTRSRIIQGEGT